MTTPMHRGGFVALAVAPLLLAGCTSPDRNLAATPSPSDSFIPVPPSMSASTAPAGCQDAPSRIVDIIDASLTDGEHLEHTQAIEGPHSTTYVGGNIFGANGMKVSSQDTWVLSNGQVYAITSDARQRTLLPDGRHVPLLRPDWGVYNAAVNTCVGQVERAENQRAGG